MCRPHAHVAGLLAAFIHLLYGTVHTGTIHGHISVNDDRGIAGDDASRVFHYTATGNITETNPHFQIRSMMESNRERRDETRIIHRIIRNDRTKITLCKCR